MKFLDKKQRFFKVVNTLNSILSRISFEICREIAADGKSFTKRDFMKKCMLIAVSRLCRGRVVFQNVSFSRITLQRIADMTANFAK